MTTTTPAARSSFVVAEIGMNHMGDERYADASIEALSVAGPDGLTFQVRENGYYAPPKPEAALLLSDEYYRRAAKRTKEGAMRFGVGLCDIGKISFFEEIGTDFYKVLSKDLGNRELVAALVATAKPVFVSTGTADEDDIQSFLEGLGGEAPANLSLIHTQLTYDDADTNLRAIGRLRERFGVPVGFGLHSKEMNALYASLGFSPSNIFFYVKGARPIKHRDEQHAVPLSHCAVVVKQVRQLEAMMGNGIKKKMRNSIPDQRPHP